jgi:adenylate cyclase
LSTERVERRLTAILAADVAGYSRLTGLDEEGTHAQLQDHLRSLVDPKIAEHRGRVVKNTGDGLLAEFSSVVDAVRCAVDVQRGMAERNTDVPQEKRIEFRIGINVGDVMAERGDIFGDGVNVAARLEAVAEPGGVCVSGRVLEDVQGKLDIAFEDAGEQRLKNIERPVRVFRVALDDARPAKPIWPRRNVAPAVRRDRWSPLVTAIGAAVVLIAGAGGAALYFHLGRAPVVSQMPGQLAKPSERFSIVVLPFANLSGDASYFADGVTDDLTTDLAQWTDSFVIDRGTAFSYKGQVVDAKQIGRELRVRYVLEGSVRRSGNRVRVGVQLIDTESGGHLWADRFDRDLSELLEMQDEITGRIALALHFKLTDVGRRRAEHSNSPDATDFEFRGQAALSKPSSKVAHAEARGFFESALKIDNRSTRAWAGLSLTHTGDVLGRWSDAPVEQLRAAEDAAAKALASNPTSPNAHLARAAVLFAQLKLEPALDEYTKVIELGRNWAHAYGRMGILNALLGRPEETFPLVEKAIRLSPRDGNLGEWYLSIGVAKFMMGQLEQAIIWLRRSTEANPELNRAFSVLASACSLAGRHEEARAALSEFLRLRPNVTISQLRTSPYSNHPAFLAWLQRFYEGLRKAGLPE